MPDADILLLEDEEGVADLVTETLEADGLTVMVAGNCADFQSCVEDRMFDLYILDILLPDGSGFDVARDVRRSDPRAGIIMLSGKAAEVDTVLGLELGADDYVPKPFRGRELLARVRSLLRRLGPSPDLAGSDDNRGVPLPGGWTMDPALRRVLDRDGADAGLTPTEYDVLRILRTHAGIPLSRDRLIELLKGTEWSANDRFMDGVISRLRRKLGEAGRAIRTIKKVGYVYASAAPDRVAGNDRG
ncbi:response regulator transcription factor [Wenxinia saemankumensis]|uniref:Two component transcriptional regulator, winged helix family n=1 Tax=Wenxinia saemankumensis TaxID=1447782 RepID=A0A1M6AF28_9RHOB|nr:response regulator transcription factor [Wenxinia saemankumensis]SHI34813.1 two component transcriptional regulator, winged helix family [Wenxinia saemankumensis]